MWLLSGDTRRLYESRVGTSNTCFYIEALSYFQVNMSQQRMQGQPMVILGEDSQRMKDKDAQNDHGLTLHSLLTHVHLKV